MKMSILVILALITAFPVGGVFGQEEEHPVYSNETPGDSAAQERSPFIPLVDDSGQMRRDFNKPKIEKISLDVLLSGICNIKGIPYAVIDGELVKEGQTYKEFKVDKVTPDSVILRLGDKSFTLSLKTEKADEKK